MYWAPPDTGVAIAQATNDGMAERVLFLAREPRLEVLAPQRGPPPVAVFALPDDPGLAQHPEVVGERRRRHLDRKRAAGALGRLAQGLDDRHPGRVREGVQDG